MLAINISLPVIPVILLMVCAFVTGLLFRGSQLKGMRRKILDLEKEMLSSHADILELEKEKAVLLKQMKESRIPVIPMNSTKEDGDKHENRHAK